MYLLNIIYSCVTIYSYRCIDKCILVLASVGKATMLSKSKDKVLSTDETAAQLQQLQLDRNTQLTTVNKAHQGKGKIEKQEKNDNKSVPELEEVFAEIQYLKNQHSVTQQQLSDVKKANTYLQNQLSLTQQQLSDVHNTNALTQQQLSDMHNTNALTQQQLSDMHNTNALTQQQLSDMHNTNALTQQQLSDFKKVNTYLTNQLSLTQQQLLGVQSMMTCSRIWVVSHDQFTIGREIGRGAWATVHETRFRGATIAAKCLHQLITSPRTRELFQREMEMALHCQHQNIVTFLGATLEGPPVILMELMDTSLRSAYEHGNIKDHQVLGILYDIARALHFLHTRPDPVIHRDVSSANVLLKVLYNREWLAKLGDLGTAKIQQQAATAGPGAIAYGAPEAGDFTKHSPKMDVYSYGVLMLEILTKTHPFQIVDTLKAQVQQQFPQYHQLVTSCTNHQSSNRPTMYDVIEHLDKIKAARP